MPNETKYPIAPEYVFDNLDSLRKLRKAMNWTKIDVAKLLKIYPEHYSMVEAGSSFPSIPLYNALACVFDWEVWQ